MKETVLHLYTGIPEDRNVRRRARYFVIQMTTADGSIGQITEKCVLQFNDLRECVRFAQESFRSWELKRHKIENAPVADQQHHKTPSVADQQHHKTPSVADQQHHKTPSVATFSVHDFEQPYAVPTFEKWFGHGPDHFKKVYSTGHGGIRVSLCHHQGDTCSLLRHPDPQQRLKNYKAQAAFRQQERVRGRLSREQEEKEYVHADIRYAVLRTVDARNEPLLPTFIEPGISHCEIRDLNDMTFTFFDWPDDYVLERSEIAYRHLGAFGKGAIQRLVGLGIDPSTIFFDTGSVKVESATLSVESSNELFWQLTLVGQ
jgi:hypothetical protein